MLSGNAGIGDLEIDLEMGEWLSQILVADGERLAVGSMIAVAHALSRSWRF